MTDDARKYLIGGKEYQLPAELVLGRTIALMEAMDGLKIPEDPSETDLLKALGAALPAWLAAVLVETGTEGTKPDLRAAADFLEANITPAQAAEVMRDFFERSPAASALNGLATIAATMLTAAGTSKTPSSSSPEATSQNGTPSSGATQ